jgi:hypothetical protein
MTVPETLANMTTSPATSASAPKRTSWIRRLTWVAAALFLLLIVFYFVATSAFFLKGVILPKVGKSMNAKVTVADASISPFSRVHLKGLMVQTVGPEPLMSADEVQVRYSLMSIMKGVMKVDELTVVNPKIRLRHNADGSSNLDPILKNQKSDSPSSGSSEPLKLDVGKVVISNGDVEMIQRMANGTETRVSLSKLNFNLQNLRNGQTAQLHVDGSSQWYSGTATSNNTANFDVKSDLNVGLTPSLGLAMAKGDGSVVMTSGTGDFAKINGFRTLMECDITPTEVRQLTWRTLAGERLLSELKVSGPMDLAKQEGRLDLVLTNFNFSDWQAFVPGMTPVGRMSATGQLIAKQAGHEVTLDLQSRLQGFGATFGSNQVSELGLLYVLNTRVTNLKRIQLIKSELTLSHRDQPAGRLTTTGEIGLNPETVSLQVDADMDLARLTQILPQPDLQLAAGRLQMTNASIQQEGTRQTLSGQILLDNLTGKVAGKEFKQLALGSSYDVAATEDGKVIDIRRVAVQLAETPRTKTNGLMLTGRLDRTRTNALAGNFKLTSEALDVTPYYDLVATDQPGAGTGTGTGRPAPSAPPPTTSTNAPVEPEPIQLPVGPMVFDAQIARLWLREVAASNVIASIQVDSNQVHIRPLSLVMNGAPLKGEIDLDLGVKGWRYNVVANAEGLPIGPLADSFVPDYRGRAKGEVWAAVKMAGVGVTGPNLRKNLAGNLSLTFTNADIQIVGPRLKGFLLPIAAALNAPGLLNSPLKWVGFGASMGSGKLDLSQVALVSPMFAAATSGDVTVGDNLASSRLGNWPMSFQLERSLAERLKLAPAETPTNAQLVALPNFVTVAGTIGEPKPNLDLKSLAGAALMKYTDKIPGLDERTSGLLKGAGGLLSRPAAGGGTNTAPATNAPGKLLDLLRPKK